MEERLRKLAESGELTGLPGEGRPFARDDLEGDDTSWAAYRLMKNNKIIPAWSQSRIDIDDELQRLRVRCKAHRGWLETRASHLKTLPADRILDTARQTARADHTFLTEIESAVKELNLRIDRYNAIVPSPSLALLPVRAGALLASG